MKKYVLVSLVVAVLASLGIILAKYINDVKTIYCFNIEGYTTAYITSEVQEYTHDLRMAHCENDIYIEVPYDYSKNTVDTKYTGKIVYYWVKDSDVKVSNKGYEMEVR